MDIGADREELGQDLPLELAEPVPEGPAGGEGGLGSLGVEGGQAAAVLFELLHDPSPNDNATRGGVDSARCLRR